MVIYIVPVVVSDDNNEVVVFIVLFFAIVFAVNIDTDTINVFNLLMSLFLIF